MIGAIIGDVVGSVYEWNNIKTKQFLLLREDCTFTDDTVMTCAVAEGIMSGAKPEDFVRSMKRLGRLYPDAGYGGRFYCWLQSECSEPYNSFGNGAAMRVSPCGWASADPEINRTLAECSAAVTHNHPEGIRAAKAISDAITLCRAGISKAELRIHIEQTYGYDLSFTLSEIRETYSFDETCQGSVPQAIVAFLESSDFEDAIRNAISIGGDSDTIAAITGSIAEAAYGVPEKLEKKVLALLDEPLREIVVRWKDYVRCLSVPTE